MTSRRLVRRTCCADRATLSKVNVDYAGLRVNSCFGNLVPGWVVRSIFVRRLHRDVDGMRSARGIAACTRIRDVAGVRVRCVTLVQDIVIQRKCLGGSGGGCSNEQERERVDANEKLHGNKEWNSKSEKEPSPSSPREQTNTVGGSNQLVERKVESWTVQPFEDAAGRVKRKEYNTNYELIPVSWPIHPSMSLHLRPSFRVFRSRPALLYFALYATEVGTK